MKTQALKQALNKYGFTAKHLAVDEETRRNQELRREFSLSEIQHRHGILRTSVRKCGSFTTLRFTRARV